VYPPSDDLRVVAQAIDRVVDVVDAGVWGLENGLGGASHSEFGNLPHRPRGDSLAFAKVVARVLVLHELRKSGALSYDEFRALKSRLLEL
jgi:hypothetical protein